MEIKGLDETIDTFNYAINNFNKESEEFLNRVANRLLGKVKARTPVDTGQLRRSWQVKRISNTERKIFNNTKYALIWGI